MAILPSGRGGWHRTTDQALRTLGVAHPFLGMPHVAEVIQEVPIAERLPGRTVGLYTRADAPLWTRPAAALARLLSGIGRRLLQGA